MKIKTDVKAGGGLLGIEIDVDIEIELNLFGGKKGCYPRKGC